MAKNEGKKLVLLSPPQIKQIAGRAGRYGLHADDGGGVATTLYKEDLPILLKALEMPADPIRYARVRIDKVLIRRIESALPMLASHSTVMEAARHTSKVDVNYETEDSTQELLAAHHLDDLIVRNGFTGEERAFMREAPLRWRDARVVPYMHKFVQQCRDDFYVDPRKTFAEFGLLEKLEYILKLADSKDPLNAQMLVKESATPLSQLELLHQVLCAYMWMSWRLPVVFSDRDVVRQLKADTERAILWTLEELSKHYARSKSTPTTASPLGPNKKSELSRSESQQDWQAVQVTGTSDTQPHRNFRFSERILLPN